MNKPTCGQAQKQTEQIIKRVKYILAEIEARLKQIPDKRLTFRPDSKSSKLHRDEKLEKLTDDLQKEWDDIKKQIQLFNTFCKDNESDCVKIREKCRINISRTPEGFAMEKMIFNKQNEIQCLRQQIKLMEQIINNQIQPQMSAVNSKRSNWEKGNDFEDIVEQNLLDANINVTDKEHRTIKRYMNLKGEISEEVETEMDRVIWDQYDEEIAILEVKSGKFDDPDQARRLVCLAKQEDLELIFVTPDGTEKLFTKNVMSELQQAPRIFFISCDNFQTAAGTSGFNYGLPPGYLE
jgi:hypothetical protein